VSTSFCSCWKLVVNGLSKRYDIIVYSKEGNVILLVECKAPNINISQDAFDQIAKYNLSVRSKYLMVSNGLSHYFCEVNYDSNNYCFLDEMSNFLAFVSGKEDIISDLESGVESLRVALAAKESMNSGKVQKILWT
jgi:hypothetical protein